VKKRLALRLTAVFVAATLLVSALILWMTYIVQRGRIRSLRARDLVFQAETVADVAGRFLMSADQDDPFSDLYVPIETGLQGGGPRHTEECNDASTEAVAVAESETISFTGDKEGENEQELRTGSGYGQGQGQGPGIGQGFHQSEDPGAGQGFHDVQEQRQDQGETQGRGHAGEVSRQSQQGPKDGTRGQMAGRGSRELQRELLADFSTLSGRTIWYVDAEKKIWLVGAGADVPEADDFSVEQEAVLAEVLSGRTLTTEAFGDLLGSMTLTAATPVIYRDETIGALFMHEDRQLIEAEVRDFGRMLLIALLLLAAVSPFVGFYLSRRFVKPLRTMQAATFAIAGGDYSKRLNASGSDEVADLARHIDRMSERLEEARAKSEDEARRRRELAASIAHELKTPVTVLRANLEALRDGVYTEGEERETACASMVQDVVVLDQLITDQLSFATLSHPDFAYQFEPVSADGIIKDALRSIRPLLTEKNLHVESQMKEHVFIRADETRFHQLVNILLNNAVRHSPPDSVIDVRLADVTEARTAAHVFSVKNTGPVIPREEQETLFEPFRKGSNSQGGGSGLGLAIARTIAKAHKWELTVKSDLDGTVFAVHMKSDSNT
jgi:signal transduction histidine kinase